ncbi:hypothetical protein ZWY2020_011963 [Hordeum vulgare]|nr:hypothetical protein ZWY2020_011963 [Hordeum vulgare]
MWIWSSLQYDIASWVCGYMDLSFGHLVALFVITPRRCWCLLKLLDCCMNQIEQYNGDFAEVRHSMIQPLRVRHSTLKGKGRHSTLKMNFVGPHHLFPWFSLKCPQSGEGSNNFMTRIVEKQEHEKAEDYVIIDAHILSTPVIADIDNDGVQEMVVAVSYFFDHE